MKVDELIKEVNSARKIKKEYDFSKRIKLKYMPYSNKCALVKSIVNGTCYVEVDGKKLFRRDSSNMLFVFTLKQLELYTDIEFEGYEAPQVYDTLMETGLMNRLMTAIPSEERNILQGMLDLQLEDEEANAHSVASFLETKYESLKIAFDSIGKVLDNPAIKAKLAEFTK